MNEETKQLLKEIKAYRDEMVAHNYPHQEISDIITRWEIKDVAPLNMNEFIKLAAGDREKMETVSEKLQDELEPINSPMSDE